MPGPAPSLLHLCPAVSTPTGSLYPLAVSCRGRSELTFENGHRLELAPHAAPLQVLLCQCCSCSLPWQSRLWILPPRSQTPPRYGPLLLTYAPSLSRREGVWTPNATVTTPRACAGRTYYQAYSIGGSSQQPSTVAGACFAEPGLGIHETWAWAGTKRPCQDGQGQVVPRTDPCS